MRTPFWSRMPCSTRPSGWLRGTWRGWTRRAWCGIRSTGPSCWSRVSIGSTGSVNTLRAGTTRWWTDMATKIVRRPDRIEGGITAEEAVLLKEHADLWISRILRTAPIEPEKIIPAIEALYAVAGLARPRVIIVPSPLVMTVAGGFSRALLRATDDATDTATDDATEDATFAATDDATSAATFAATFAATDDATSAATRDATS